MIIFQVNLVQKINTRFAESQQNFIIIIISFIILISEESNGNNIFITL